MPIDYKKYPSDWKEIRKRILKRADNRCEMCGLVNHSIVYSIELWIRDDKKGRYKQKAIWFSNIDDAKRTKGVNTIEHYIKLVKVVLTIAHLDHDETNHEVKDERLAALCQYCHLNYDAEEKWERQKRKWNK